MGQCSTVTMPHLGHPRVTVVIFVNILNTQVLSHSARRTRLLWPWSQTTISDNGVCSSEGTARASTAHSIHKSAFVQWDPRSPNRQVQAYLKWPRCRCVNVLERNGNPPLQISLLEVCLLQGVQGLWLATFLPVQRGVNMARLSPRAKRAQSDWQATVTLGWPRCYA
jgi:hypothetical protein